MKMIYIRTLFVTSRAFFKTIGIHEANAAHWGDTVPEKYEKAATRAAKRRYKELTRAAKRLGVDE